MEVSKSGCERLDPVKDASIARASETNYTELTRRPRPEEYVTGVVPINAREVARMNDFTDRTRYWNAAGLLGRHKSFTRRYYLADR
jgi:hypothetical protein